MTKLDLRVGEEPVALLETACHRKSGAFGKLRQEWMAVLDHVSSAPIFLTWQRQSAWWEAFESGKELFLLTHRSEQGRLVGVCPFYRTSSGSEARVLRLVGGFDLSDYLDLLCVAGFEAAVCAATVQYLVSHDGEWDVLDLHCLPADSPTRRVLLALCQQHGYSVREVVEEECPVLILPDTWGEYLRGLSGKDRHELRRKMRRAAPAVAPGIERVSSDKELEAALEDFFSLHRGSGPGKESFLSAQVQEFFRAFARSFFEAGWLDLCFLSADGQRVASLLCFEWGDATHVYNSGYDPQYASLSVGIVLLGRFIQDAIARRKKRVDFLRGRERYKYQLGGRAVPIYQLTVYKRALPPELG